MTSCYDAFLKYAFRVATPVISAGAAARLKTSMPVQCGVSGIDRSKFSHLEALARTLNGLAPVLELLWHGNTEDEHVVAAQKALMSVSDPESPDYLNFKQGRQPLVDAAFLAQSFLRAPNALWNSLDVSCQGRFIALLRDTRNIPPGFNNWLLFSALIEAFFAHIGEEWDFVRVDYALRQFEQWYIGDGLYSDGPKFCANYYNSFVIFPFLLDITGEIGRHGWEKMKASIVARAQRHAEILERLIGPDGSFPILGRSITYRCGAFHLLSQLAWKSMLPDSLPEGQVRCALLAVVEKTLGSKSNFDSEGWLRIGINGSQPELAEGYISTGSLYLCATAFLPLGLSRDHSFWTAPSASWTSKRIWAEGGSLPPDEAFK